MPRSSVQSMLGNASIFPISEFVSECQGSHEPKVEFPSQPSRNPSTSEKEPNPLLTTRSRQLYPRIPRQCLPIGKGHVMSNLPKVGLGSAAVKLSRNPAVDFVPMKNESVLFEPQTNQFCLLNATAAFVWKELEHPRTVSDHASALCDHFDSIRLEDAISDVEQTINELLSLGFLVTSQSSDDSSPKDGKPNHSPSTTESQPKPKYETPRMKIMTEQEVLSAFQVTAAGTMMWWG